MKIAIRRISTLLLIPILLWAGAGFSLSRHYCLGMLVEENFYYEAESCGMESLTNDFDNHSSECGSEAFEDHTSCCDDEWINVASVEVETSSKNSVDQSIYSQDEKPASKILKGSLCGDFDQVLKADYLEGGPPQIKGELNPKLSKYLAEIQSYLI